MGTNDRFFKEKTSWRERKVDVDRGKNGPSEFCSKYSPSLFLLILQSSKDYYSKVDGYTKVVFMCMVQ